ncbi:MAG TPA: hypothetical protein VFW67_13455, partial [Burkholderiaceae bacterium]|nr:hypothetical protein [Burkholderiaceae bacterium]
RGRSTANALCPIAAALLHQAKDGEPHMNKKDLIETLAAKNDLSANTCRPQCGPSWIFWCSGSQTRLGEFASTRARSAAR